MNKIDILESAKDLELFLDEAWVNPNLKKTDMMPLFEIHKLLIKLHKEKIYEIKPRKHLERRNAIDLGELKNVISRQP